jgi:hypothetical protein
MKKIIFSFALLVTVAAITPAFANDTLEPDPQVLRSFQKEFSTAHDVRWDKEEGYDKAVFGLAGHRVIAYFSETGQLEGCIRDLFFDQLPLSVMTALDKKFPDAVIFSVREISNSNGTSYQLILESKAKKLDVKVAPDGSIQTGKHRN